MEDKILKGPMKFFKDMPKNPNPKTWEDYFPEMSEEEKRAESTHDLREHIRDVVKWYTGDAYKPSQKILQALFDEVLEEYTKQWPE